MISQSFPTKPKNLSEILLRAKPVWPVFYVISVAVLIIQSFSHWVFDDPFITYRYAINVAKGYGFVYNPGERVLGTTTPLFTLVLAISHLLGFKPHPTAIYLGAISLGLGAYFIWRISQSFNTSWVGWTGLFLYPTFPLLLTTLGSEIPLYLALSLGSFASFYERRWKLTALLSALVCLTRPDGLIVPAILLAQSVFEKRSIPWKASLIFISIVGSWLAFAWIYFGSPIPVSLFAKQAQGTLSVSQSFVDGFLTLAQSYAGKWHWQLKTIFASAGFVIITLRHPRWLPLLAWPILHFLSYTLLGVSSYFWYYAPLVPGYLVCLGVGLQILETKTAAYTSKRIPGIVSALFLIVFLAAQVYSFLNLRQQEDERFSIYRAAGQWIQNNTPVNATLGALEVGYIGYFSRRAVINFAGLLQPEIAHYMLQQESYEDGAIFATQRFKPDYLILHENFFPNLESILSQFGCEIVRFLDGDQYDYQGSLVIYHCLYP